MDKPTRTVVLSVGFALTLVAVCAWVICTYAAHGAFIHPYFLWAVSGVGLLLLLWGTLCRAPSEDGPVQQPPPGNPAGHTLMVEQCWADWRHFDSAIWQIPVAAFVITTAVVGVAYEWLAGQWPEKALLLSLLVFVNLTLWYALSKHRWNSDRRCVRIRSHLQPLGLVFPREVTFLSAYRLLWLAICGTVLLSAGLALRAWVDS